MPSHLWIPYCDHNSNISSPKFTTMKCIVKNLIIASGLVQNVQSFMIPKSSRTAIKNCFHSVSSLDKEPASPLHYKNKNNDDENTPSWWLSSSENSPPESEARKERLKKLQAGMAQFAQGQELDDLRSDIKQLKKNLHLSLATDDLMRFVSLSKSLESLEEKDPEYVYLRALKKITNARDASGKYNTRKKYEIITHYTKEAEHARDFIPRLNMDGLFVANFGKGSELVNVTYSGDTLLAERLNEPGHVFIQVDLCPRDNKKDSNLSPIQLDTSAASKWGVEKLERYPGKARDTLSKGSHNSDLIDGNLIMFDGYFSFLWIPTRQHVFFSRPKPETILSLLRDRISEDDEISNMREHLSKCYDKDISEAFIRPNSIRRSEPFRRIASEADLLAAKEETKIDHDIFSLVTHKKGKQNQSFWDFHKWMVYIDKTLNPNEMEKKENQ